MNESKKTMREAMLKVKEALRAAKNCPIEEVSDISARALDQLREAGSEDGLCEMCSCNVATRRYLDTIRSCDECYKELEKEKFLKDRR